MASRDGQHVLRHSPLGSDSETMDHHGGDLADRQGGLPLVHDAKNRQRLGDGFNEIG